MNICKIDNVTGGTPPVSVDVEVLDINGDRIKLRRLKDSEIVEIDRVAFDRMRRRLIDQSSAFGNDCPNGRCEG